MTVYLPDDLAAEVKGKLGDTNISAVCQDALRDELARQEAIAKISEEGFERVEVYDDREDADLAFQGREIGNDYNQDAKAYLTPKGAIAVYDGKDQRLFVYDDYDAFAADVQAGELAATVAASLGEKYVRELDI